MLLSRSWMGSTDGQSSMDFSSSLLRTKVRFVRFCRLSDAKVDGTFAAGVCPSVVVGTLKRKVAVGVWKESV